MWLCAAIQRCSWGGSELVLGAAECAWYVALYAVSVNLWLVHHATCVAANYCWWGRKGKWALLAVGLHSPHLNCSVRAFCHHFAVARHALSAAAVVEAWAGLVVHVTGALLCALPLSDRLGCGWVNGTPSGGILDEDG